MIREAYPRPHPELPPTELNFPLSNEITAETLAHSLVDICSQFDLPDVDTGVMSPLRKQLIDLVRNLPGTDLHRRHVQSLTFQEPVTDGAQMSGFLERLGIDLEEERYGVCSIDGAKEYELRQLNVFLPIAISNYIQRGEIGESERLLKLRGQQQNQFNKTYTD